ncbi:MAG: hypothetical protein EOO27_45475 [Comamonadaceae bacterium]|nr:MAG: hypothetical protein EOO27_45475 [Comamonadaceae bacterium]
MAKNSIQLRLINMGGEIATSPPEDLSFQHSVLTQCSLPVGKPADGVLVWERQQGRARLRVEAGSALNPKTGQYVQLPLPYGPKARLLLIHLNTEAVRRQSPIIPIEATMTAFFRRLMGDGTKTQDGRTSNLLKTQLSALAAATFRMGIAESDHAFQMNTQVVHAFDMWLSRDESQRVLWPSTLRLSLDYFENLTKFAVPLDERAISTLAHSALVVTAGRPTGNLAARYPSAVDGGVNLIMAALVSWSGVRSCRFPRSLWRGGGSPPCQCSAVEHHPKGWRQ